MCNTRISTGPQTARPKRKQTPAEELSGITTVAKRPKASKINTSQQTKKTALKHQKSAKQAKAVKPGKKARKSLLASPNRAKKSLPAVKKESDFAASAKAAAGSPLGRKFQRENAVRQFEHAARKFECYGCCKTFYANVQKDGLSNWWWCSDMCRGFGYVQSTEESKGVTSSKGLSSHGDWHMVRQKYKQLLKEGLPAVQKRVPNENALVNPSRADGQRQRNSSSSPPPHSSSSPSGFGSQEGGSIAAKQQQQALQQQALLHYTDFCTLFEEARELAGAEREDVRSISAGNLGRVYGETMPPLVHQIMTELDIGPTDTFLNIGSGLLNVVLQAAFTTGADCMGVEVDQERFQQGEQIYRELKKLLKKLGAGGAGRIEKTEEKQLQLTKYHSPFPRVSGCEGNDNSDPTCDRLVLGGLQGPSLEHCWGDITQKLTKKGEADSGSESSGESGSSGDEAGENGDEESGGEGGGGSAVEKRTRTRTRTKMQKTRKQKEGEESSDEPDVEVVDEAGHRVEHRFGPMLKKATVIYMNNFDGTFGTREHAGGQGDKQRCAGATTESLLNDMFVRYLEDGTKLITMQKLPDIGWFTERTQLWGTDFGKSWNPSESGYGVYIYTVNRHWKCIHCTVVQKRGTKRECEVCGTPRRGTRDSAPTTTLQDSWRTD
jgi:hypothetical protein